MKFIKFTTTRTTGTQETPTTQLVSVEQIVRMYTEQRCYKGEYCPYLVLVPYGCEGIALELKPEGTHIMEIIVQFLTDETTVLQITKYLA